VKLHLLVALALAAGGLAVLPSVEAAPGLPICATDYCIPTCAVKTLEGKAASVTVRSDCSLLVKVGQQVACPVGWDARSVNRDLDVVQVQGKVCMPGLECTCPPMQSAAAAQLPVEIEFVQCVTEPCPPIVRCTTSTSHAGVFQVDRSRNCHLTLTQDPLPCEGTRHEWTTVGPVTVGRSYCGPGIDPGANAMAPPIVCVMAPCGPQCLVPCFPPAQVPDGCDVKAAVDDLTNVFGDDCTIEVEPTYMCVGGWGSDHDVTVGFVTVTVRLCGQPLPDWQ
jgi:hypothetical protein